jgi:hypothetical protein
MTSKITLQLILLIVGLGLLVVTTTGVGAQETATPPENDFFIPIRSLGVPPLHTGFDQVRLRDDSLDTGHLAIGKGQLVSPLASEIAAFALLDVSRAGLSLGAPERLLKTGYASNQIGLNVLQNGSVGNSLFIQNGNVFFRPQFNNVSTYVEGNVQVLPNTLGHSSAPGLEPVCALPNGELIICN